MNFTYEQRKEIADCLRDLRSASPQGDVLDLANGEYLCRDSLAEYIAGLFESECEDFDVDSWAEYAKGRTDFSELR